eukprot:GHVU01059977.1.p2 GENE.GHVU01059977.1~~GHVU01059977.1.p2  ORF type:complete len:123 (+),score=19.62 GHVU01059977.1:896-1264(+)
MHCRHCSPVCSMLLAAQHVGKLVMDAVVEYNRANPSKKINTLLVPDAAPDLWEGVAHEKVQERREKYGSVEEARKGYITGLLEGKGDENRPVIEISCAHEAVFKAAMSDLRSIRTLSECLAS